MAKQTFTTGQVLTAAQVNSLQTNDFNQTVSAKTASYILVAADKGTRIEFNTSGSVTCTVNTGLFDAGDTLIIQNRGAGAVTITAGTATVNTSASLVLNQYDSGTLYFISTDAALWFGASPGDITGITTGATSGLSGGVTSGTANLKLAMAAKGDLLVGTGSGTSSLLTVGANNTALVADSTTATGLKWATPSSGYTLISRQTFTSVATLTLDNIFSSTYDNYQIVLLYGNSDETANLNMQFRYGATPTTATLYYNWDYQINSTSAGTSSVGGGENDSSIRLVAGTGSQLAVHMFISSFSDRLWGGYFAFRYSNNAGSSSGYRGNFNNRFARSGSDAYHGLHFLNTAGTASGSISIYGQAKS